MTAGRTNSKQLSRDWGTPSFILDGVTKVFCGPIELDPCSNNNSIVKANVKYLLPNKDGLLETWNFRTIYVNPPYGSDFERGTRIINWISKCAHAHYTYGSEVLALIPVAVNTRHWKDYIWGVATSVCFLAEPRLKFLVNGREDGKGAPMACAVVYWGQKPDLFKDVFGKMGAVVTFDIEHDKINRIKSRNMTIFDIAI